jgi:hypothetical protein
MEGGRTPLTSLSVRVPEQPGYCAGSSLMILTMPSSSNLPALTSLKLLTCAPSSHSSLENGGIDPARICQNQHCLG